VPRAEQVEHWGDPEAWSRGTLRAEGRDRVGGGGQRGGQADSASERRRAGPKARRGKGREKGMADAEASKELSGGQKKRIRRDGGEGR